MSIVPTRPNERAPTFERLSTVSRAFHPVRPLSPRCVTTFGSRAGFSWLVSRKPPPIDHMPEPGSKWKRSRAVPRKKTCDLCDVMPLPLDHEDRPELRTPPKDVHDAVAVS